MTGRRRKAAEGSRPLPTKRLLKRGALARLRAGRARPLRTSVNGWWAGGAREGGSPPPFPLTGCRGRLRAAYMPPLQSCRLPLRGFGGAWRRTTSAASLLRKPARAVVCPAGANIVRTPVSFHSTVVLRSQPRNARPLQLSSAAPAHPPASHSPSAPTAPSLQWRYRAQSSPPLPSL